MNARPSLVELMLLIPEEKTPDARRLLPSAFDALRKKVALEPHRPRDHAALTGGGPVARVMLLHPDFLPAKGYPTSWISLASAPLKKVGANLLLVGFSLGNDGEQLVQGWKVALELAPLLASETGAALGFLNGGAIDDERSVFPPDRSTTSLPSAITPWVYLGAAMLDDGVRARLKDLPAFRTEPLGDGWQVQAVERLTEEPSPELLSGLASLRDEPITYQGPR